MNPSSCCAATLAGLAIALGAVLGAPAPAVAATAAEELYAELAKLPPAEREKRLVEGAQKENKFVMRPVFRGPNARDHNKIFQTRYPTVKLDSLDQGMSVVDSSGVITLWNDTLERILDCPRHRALGHPVAVAVPGLSKSELPRAITDRRTA